VSVTADQILDASNLQVGSSYSLFTKGSSYIIAHPLGDDTVSCLQNGTSGKLDYFSTNQYEAFQFAIGNLSTLGGGSIALKSGIYTSTVGPVINCSNIYLIGEDRDATIIQVSSDVNVLTIQGVGNAVVENVKVANLCLKGVGKATATKDGIYGYRVWYSAFENLKVYDCYNGIKLDGAWTERGARNTITKSITRDNKGSGLYFNQQDSVTIDEVSSFSNGYGAYLEWKCQGFKIEGFRADDNDYDGLHIKEAQVLHSDSNLISDSGGYGVFIGGGSSSLYFNKLYVESSGETQVFISPTESPYDCDRISFTECEFVRGQKYGLAVVGANNASVTNVEVTGCNIVNNGQATNNTYWGMYFAGSGANATTHVRITGGYVGNSAVDSGDAYQNGIQMMEDSDYFTIEGVDVSSAWQTITYVGTHNKIVDNVGFVTENTVLNVANTTATTFMFNHGCASTVNSVLPSFNFTGWTSWTWTSTTTEVTITITGTLPAAMKILAADVKYVP
jgi:hypothetical protein